MPVKLYRSLYMLLVSSLLTACSSGPILHQVQELSRDYIYIAFSQNTEPYQVQAVIGGEHQNIYKVLGFRGDRFTITIESLDGEAMYSFDGEGYRVINYYGNEEKNLRVEEIEVTGQDAWINFYLYAHPIAEYRFTVTRE